MSRTMMTTLSKTNNGGLVKESTVDMVIDVLMRPVSTTEFVFGLMSVAMLLTIFIK